MFCFLVHFLISTWNIWVSQYPIEVPVKLSFNCSKYQLRYNVLWSPWIPRKSSWDPIVPVKSYVSLQLLLDYTTTILCYEIIIMFLIMATIFCCKFHVNIIFGVSVMTKLCIWRICKKQSVSKMSTHSRLINR